MEKQRIIIIGTPDDSRRNSLAQYLLDDYDVTFVTAAVPHAAYGIEVHLDPATTHPLLHFPDPAAALPAAPTIQVERSVASAPVARPPRPHPGHQCFEIEGQVVWALNFQNAVRHLARRPAPPDPA